ncbi:hypothetical protein OY671_010043, partial [Metschnikowia pulcherrima]
KLHAAGSPYVVSSTDPTTGGVTASYAMSGDVQIAEPGASIGFAGQRVIQDTIREKSPEGFQRAEYLHAHGMLDMVVHRRDMKATSAQVIDYLTAGKAAGRGWVRHTRHPAPPTPNPSRMREGLLTRDFAMSENAAVQAQLDRSGASSSPQGRFGSDTARESLARVGNPHLASPP